jgi:hypothetical protein
MVELARSVELGDFVLLLYVAAFVRQYLWLIDNSALAWILTVPITLLGGYFLVVSKRSLNDEERVPRLFWAIVGFPLLVIYTMRLAFPDGSFDQLNYHLMNAERGLSGLPFKGGDFFPAPFQFNPAPDMAAGITRYLLGYRLGTIINYLAMLWAGNVLYKLLGSYIRNRLWRCFGVLLIVLTEQPLFEINNYMIDVLAVPLCLEATYLILNPNKMTQRRDLVRVALFLGASVAFKLTNLALVLPLVLVYAYRTFEHKSFLKWKESALFVIAFLAPLLPFTIFIYWQTQSPVFPFYNKVFRSPYWPLINWADVRWGPKGILEALVWPVVVTFKPERTNELAVYSGRLSVIFVAVICCLLIRPATKNTRTLCLIVLLGLASWTVSTGHVRYATCLEFLGGVGVLALANQITLKVTRFTSGIRQGLVLLLWGVLGMQSLIASKYVSRYEWGMRSTIFTDPKSFLLESRNLLRDHSFLKFVPLREQKLFDEVDVWVESNFITNGVETMLRRDAPIIFVCFNHYFETQDGLDRFEKALASAAGKKMYTLSFKKDLSPSLDILSFRGLEMGKFIPVSIPFYSNNIRFDMVLIEILPPGKGIRREYLKTTSATSPLPANGFKADLSFASAPPPTVKAGQRAVVYVKIKNTSESTWPASGKSDGMYAINLANHWFNERGTMVVQDDGRTSLILDLLPGQEQELPLVITAPAEPGHYTLEADVVQELVTWFGSVGSKTLRSQITVVR